MSVKDINEVCGVSGSCMLIDQKLIDRIGYFDENYFAYQEDSDYCYRAIKNGWKVYYYPKSIVIHEGGTWGLIRFHLNQFLNGIDHTLCIISNTLVKIMEFFLILSI